jgi:hypothetical protein
VVFFAPVLTQPVKVVPLGAARTLAPATDEVHNLKPVPVSHCGMVPLAAGNDITVLFDSKPVTFKAQFGNQIANLGARRQLRKFTRLPINDKVHMGRVSPRFL